jgi:secondary thiamine-phosphate synthase enzyme
LIRTLTIPTPRQGLLDITREVQQVVSDSGISDGLCTVFVQHTSASLVIQENADPAVRHDLEDYLGRLVPENDPRYTHTDEGPDDMPSHIRGVLTATTLSIPVVGRRLTLGTWQGIYLWEHRRVPSGGTRPRRVVVAVMADAPPPPTD